MGAAVVFDINILVKAAAGGNNRFLTWPVLPPGSPNHAADCLGAVNDPQPEFSLWLSPHIVLHTEKVLAEGLKWPDEDVSAYSAALVTIAEKGAGGVIENVPRTVIDECPDWEDNLILDLAAEVGAVMIVSSDVDLLSMSPWRGHTPIVTAETFTGRVQAARRHSRPRRR